MKIMYTSVVRNAAMNSIVPGLDSRFRLNVVPGSLPAAESRLPAKPGNGILMSVLESSVGMPSLQIANTTTTMM